MAPCAEAETGSMPLDNPCWLVRKKQAVLPYSNGTYAMLPNPAGKPTRNVPTPEQADQTVSGIQAGMTLDSELAWPRTQVSMACAEMGSPATEIKRGETA